MSLNLKDKPFYLSDEDITWVEDTMSKMTIKEKASQLFCLLVKNKPVDEMISEMESIGFYPGGYMTEVFPAKKIKENFKKLQSRADIPLLFASNLERGADSTCKEGTIFGTPMQIAASNDVEWAYELGRVSAEEAMTVGCNWNFGPIVDIDTNFHNPITNTRAFSSNPDMVLDMSKSYIRGQMDAGMAVCLKHWPGDGKDGRDQHLLTTINNLSVDEWDKTYGRVYSELSEQGAQTVMSAHILLPSYSRKFQTDIKDEDIQPGSLSYDLTTTLLREEIGFNGLVVTDSTAMTGFMQMMPRRDGLPACIMAGCDMILFTLDIEEDFNYILDAIEEGVITHE